MNVKMTMRAVAMLAASLFVSANAVCFGAEQDQDNEMENNEKTQEETSTMRSATSYPEGSAVFHNGKLSVQGTHMVNECGKPVQLRGMSSHGLAWTPAAYTEESITALVDKWNIDLFRIAIYTHEWGGYCMTGSNQWKTPEEYNEYIDGLVDICGKLGIYCLIDWHVLNQGSGDPNNTLDEAIPFWDYMSKKHKDDIHVIYEICNEPNGGGVDWETVKEYADTVIPVIRKNDPEKIVVCGSPTWSQDVDKAADDPLEYDNIMYTLHFYAGTHFQYLRDKAEYAMNKGLAIFVTEFGTSKADGNGGVFTEECDEWMKWMDKYMISWANWSFVDKNETSAGLVPGSVAKKQWTNLSASGKYIMSNLWVPKSYESCQGVEVVNRKYVPDVYPLAAVKAANGSAFYHNGMLRVDGAKFVNMCEKTTQLKGFTTGNAALNQECLTYPRLFNFIANDWNASVMRVSVHADGKGGYCATGSDQVMDQILFNDYLDNIVSSCARTGMYCVLDWHLNNGDPMSSMEEAKTFWSFVSARYQKFDNVMCEICSNPTVEWETIKSYADTIIPMIRENNPNKVIICGMPKGNRDIEAVMADPLKVSNVAYGLNIFAGSDAKEMRSKISNAVAKGFPVMVTDLSLLSSADANTLSLDEANEWINFLNDNRITWACSKFASDGSVSASLNLGGCDAGDWTVGSTAGEFMMKRLAEANGFESCVDEVENILNDDLVEIYPNPVKDVLKVSASAEMEAKMVQIYDMTGRLIMSDDELEINLASLSAGVYYVKVIFPEGVVVKRIVKE